MILHLCLSCVLAVVASAQPRVVLDQGVATGLVGSTPGGNVVKFLGLPYAAPPIGKLRFRPPMAAPDWAPSVYDATRFQANCPQDKEILKYFHQMTDDHIQKMDFSEDCLFLNVYVPGSSLNDSARLPVMVWIHGGDYRFSSGRIIGSTSKVSPEGLVTSGDVIVVTINYRLGVFGFLTLGGANSMATPNNGLRDQIAALKWIRKNIGKFGGDRTRITLFGDEMGGRSVQLHMFMEPSFRLFTRAAVSSGAYTGWGLPTQDDAWRFWCQYAETVGCRTPVSSVEDVISCLQEKPVYDLMKKAPDSGPTVVIDQVLLKDQLSRLLKAGRFKPVELLIGCNTADGDFALFAKPEAPRIYREGLTAAETKRATGLLRRLGYPMTNTKTGRRVQELVEALYLAGDLSDPKQNLVNAVTMLTDAFFYAPVFELGHANRRQKKPSFAYFFEQNTSAAASRRRQSGMSGAGIGDEVTYVMGDLDGVRKEEADFVRSVVRAWSSFARTGWPEFLDDGGVVHRWPELDDNRTLVVWSSPMSASSIVSSTARGPLYFNMLLAPLAKFMEKDEKGQSKQKPNQGNSDMPGRWDDHMSGRWDDHMPGRWDDHMPGRRDDHMSGRWDDHMSGRRDDHMSGRWDDHMTGRRDDHMTDRWNRDTSGRWNGNDDDIPGRWDDDMPDRWDDHMSGRWDNGRSDRWNSHRRGRWNNRRHGWWNNDPRDSWDDEVGRPETEEQFVTEPEEDGRPEDGTDVSEQHSGEISQMTYIVLYVMLAFVCFLVLLVFVVCFVLIHVLRKMKYSKTKPDKP